MEIEHKRPLAPLTTLKVGGVASYYADVRSIPELREAVAFARLHSLPIAILGGGSNVLVRDSGIDALVIHPDFTDITYSDEQDGVVTVEAGAGVLLDDLVRDTVERGLWGLENLSHIPGTVGGVPIQNVGAYGVEAKDVVTQVHVYDSREDTTSVLTRDACRFGYRTSLFKEERGKSYVVTAVTFLLSTIPTPRIGYKDLTRYFEGKGTPTQKEIRTAVTNIRAGKFPDWHTVGTAGSFFKNPLITEEVYRALTVRYPDLPGFPTEGKIKIPLGWILDHVLHLKGYREGNVGLYEAQALVLVAERHATAEDIYAFSERIIQKIFDATGIRVEREVVVF